MNVQTANASRVNGGTEAVSVSAPGRLRRWLIRLGLLAIVCLLVLVLVEIGLRVCGVAYPMTSQTDPYRGTAFRPGIEFWQREEGEAYITINSDGFRDREHAIAKPPNTVRIAVLGDSYTDAVQIPQEQRFTEILEVELNRRKCFGFKAVEVLNFGMGGYGTVQELMVLRHSAWKYDPDIVVLAVMTGNDLRNNSKILQNDPGRPYFVFKDGQLVFDDSFRSSSDYIQTNWKRLGYTCIEHSRILQLIYRTRRILEKRQAKSEARDRVTGVPDELGLDSLIYREPTDPHWIEAWEIMESLLAMMHVEVKQKGAEFLAVTLSNSVQDCPDQEVRMQLMESLGVETLSYPDERIKSVGERQGFEVVTLAPICLEFAEKHKAYLHGFENSKIGKGHWNEKGHRLAGEVLAEEICRLRQGYGL